MKNKEKTAAQLMLELRQVRRRLSKLEKAESQRKQTLQALKESERRYRALFSGAAEGILCTDIETKEFKHANPAICRMLGYAEKELKRLKVIDIHPKESLDRVISEFEAQARGEKALAINIPCLRKDGATIFADICSAKVVIDGKECYVDFFTDITERKRAEEALGERESKYKTLLESLPQKIFFKDKRSNYISCNDNYAQDLHIKADEIAGKTDYDFYPKGLANKYRADDRRVMLSGKTEDIQEEYILDGQKRFVQTVKTPVRDEKGNLVGILGIFWDITDRKRAQEALHESEERYRDLFENSNDLIQSVTPDGRFLYVNRAWKETLGYSQEEIAELSLFDIIHPNSQEHCMQMFQKIISGEKIDRVEAIFVAKDGREIILEGSASCRFKDGQPFSTQGIFQDITERKRAEEKLKQTLAELECSNAELQQFAYVASHDLQEPLRMVASYVQLLARRYQGKLDDDADEFINFAVDGAGRMQGLINALLDYSRVGTRGKPFEPTDCEIVLNRALANLQAATIESGAEVDHKPLPTVMADDVQLTQLFQNLIGNAIKFHNEKPPRVHVSAEKKGQEWVFSVQDNGIGIAPEYAQRIFLIFQRLHDRSEYKGTGIGLAVCKKIVERHGGRIWVDSQPGQGSTFYFTLPVAES